MLFKNKKRLNYKWFNFFLIVLLSHHSLNRNSKKYTHYNSLFAVSNHKNILLSSWDKFTKYRKLIYLFFKKINILSQSSEVIVCIFFKISTSNIIIYYKPVLKLNSSCYFLRNSNKIGNFFFFYFKCLVFDLMSSIRLKFSEKVYFYVISSLQKQKVVFLPIVLILS